jgi:hypothetical protein
MLVNFAILHRLITQSGPQNPQYVSSALLFENGKTSVAGVTCPWRLTRWLLISPCLVVPHIQGNTSN